MLLRPPSPTEGMSSIQIHEMVSVGRIPPPRPKLQQKHVCQGRGVESHRWNDLPLLLLLLLLLVLLPLMVMLLLPLLLLLCPFRGGRHYDYGHA